MYIFRGARFITSPFFCVDYMSFVLLIPQIHFSSNYMLNHTCRYLFKNFYILWCFWLSDNQNTKDTGTLHCI
jgi:hypothetical protein